MNAWMNSRGDGGIKWVEEGGLVLARGIGAWEREGVGGGNWGKNTRVSEIDVLLLRARCITWV